MTYKFDKFIDALHDARLFGFLLDFEPHTFNLNLILYVQLFSDYENGKYSIEKGLAIFEKASIHKLSIIEDLNSAQFYIVDIEIKDLENAKFMFTFKFNEPSIELVLIAENLNIRTSGFIEENEEQFLPSIWNNLLK